MTDISRDSDVVELSGPPCFDYGEKVRSRRMVRNDGSFPGRGEDEQLAEAGQVGEIVRVGHHVEANQPIYLVDFGGELVVGCFEDELQLL